MSLLVRRALPSILLFPALAHAQEDPASTPDELEVLTQRVELLESELAAVEAELLLQQQAAVLREAEALARDLPPLSPAPSSGPSRLNPGLTAFGDVLGTAGLGPDGLTPGSGPWLRSLELDLRASVDPFANAVAVLAVHQEAPLQLELHDEHDHDHDHEDEDEDEEHEEHEEHDEPHVPEGVLAH